MNNKLISEEILRIHELMGLGESLLKDILISNDLKSTIKESLIASAISSALKISDLADIARTIKNSSLIDATGNLIRAAEKPHAETLLRLEGNPEEFVRTLKEFADEAVGTPKRKVADEIIGDFITKVHNVSNDLKNLESTTNGVKNDLITNNGLSNDEAVEQIQKEIDELFYGKDGEEPLVKFSDESLRDIYVYDLRKKLNLDTKWERPVRVEPEDTRTPEEISAEIELAKKQAIEAKFNSYKKIGEDLEKASKKRGDKPPFEMPNIFKKSNFKEELITSIRDAVDSRFASRIDADAAKIEDWISQLERLTPLQKEKAITDAASRANRASEKWVEKTLNYITNKGIKLGQDTLTKIKDFPKHVKEFFTLLFKGNVKEAIKFLFDKIQMILYVFILEMINQYAEYTLRLYYDKDTLLPTFYVGMPPIEEGVMSWVGWIGKILISGPLFVYDTIAVITNSIYGGIYYAGGTYKDKLESNIKTLKDEGILPDSQLDRADDNSIEALSNFLQKVLPEDKKELIKDILSGQTQSIEGYGLGTIFSNLGNINLLNWDNLVGLPLDQFFVVGKNIYFANQNGRFTVKGLDTDDPYIEGKYDNEGEVEKVSIKKMFFNENGNTINRFLVDFYPVDEQSKLVEKTTKFPKTITPDNKFGTNQSNYNGTIGLVISGLSELKTELATAGIENLNMDDVFTYNFYPQDQTSVNPTLPGYRKANAGANKVGTQLYYLDQQGTPDELGNYPVYRLVKTSKESTKYKPNTWYILKDNTTWTPLSEYVDSSQGTTQSTTPAGSAETSETPKEKFEREKGIKLTLLTSTGSMAVYKGSDNKNYKLENGNIVEF